MKTTILKNLKSLYAVALIATTLLASSCKKEKDKMIPPILEFRTGGGYTYENDSVGLSDTLLVGVHAEKTEDKDLLRRFVGTQAFDGNSATTFINESFDQDTYDKDFTIITRNVAGVEKYTFTIINRDGLTKTISFELYVN